MTDHEKDSTQDRLPLLSERGIALPLALFGLVIIGALLAGVFHMSRMEQRHGDNSISRAQAAEAAEAGLATMVAGWNPAVYNRMANAAETTLTTVGVGGGNTYTTTLRRINQATYLASSEGRHVNGVGAVITRRRLGRLLRLNIPTIDVNAAITTRAGITVSGSSEVSGNDSVPPQWAGDCPPPGATAPGIRDSSGNVTTTGACSGASCITGDPPIQTDPTVNSGSFTQFGDLSFADLAALATKVVTGTVTGVGPTINLGPPATCRTGDALNWGDPLNPAGPCYDFFPIIYSPGNLRISGGWGQGILLVGGDFEISGGHEFYGPVIVLGQVTSTGTGGHILGGLMASDAELNTSLVSGNSTVTFSRCSVTRALQGTSHAKEMGSRSWSQLF